MTSILGGPVSPADATLIEKHGFVAGFAGYKNVKNSGGMIIMIDQSLENHHRAVTGANRDGWHLIDYDIFKYVKKYTLVDVAINII